MKKYVLIAVAATLMMISCRKDADYMPYVGESPKLAYSTYTEQFEYLWKTISTAYVFWDIDTVDSDATYTRLLPGFKALDQKYEDSGFVRATDLEPLYTSMFGSMIDHHMTVYVENLHPHSSETYPSRVIISPASIEVPKRSYYLEDRSTEQAGIQTFLSTVEANYTVLAHESGTFVFTDAGMSSSVTLHYCLFQLPDGRVVPYLWQSMAALTPLMNEKSTPAGKALIEHWLQAICDRNDLAGIILDNRANRGGFQDDLDYLIGPFVNESVTILETRYKEGPGRLEYSAWCPYYQNPNPYYHRDIAAENIPYVILTSVNTVSMGEIEPLTAREVITTTHVMGERSWGGTCPLQTNSVDLNYNAPYGDGTNALGHYIYSSTFGTRINGQRLEGIGCVPDEVINRKDDPTHSFKKLLDTALNYIQNH
jgi:hypothetical protein